MVFEGVRLKNAGANLSDLPIIYLTEKCILSPSISEISVDGIGIVLTEFIGMTMSLIPKLGLNTGALLYTSTYKV